MIRGGGEGVQKGPKYYDVKYEQPLTSGAKHNCGNSSNNLLTGSAKYNQLHWQFDLRN